MALQDAIVRGLSEGVRCPIITEPGVLARFSQDFGQNERKQPSVVVHAEREADVAHALRVARTLGVPVSIRGSGHTSGGHTLNEGGIVVVNTDGGEVLPREDGSVEVTSRTRWADVVAALGARGRIPPVLTAVLETTVGGTLSVGGYGAQSIVHGAQVDQVERLKLLCPDGTSLWCSPTENAELFRFSLAGLGQLGFIERVVMRTSPLRPFLHVQVHAHRTLGELVDALGWLVTEREQLPDTFYGVYREGVFRTVLAYSHATEAEAQACTPVAGMRTLGGLMNRATLSMAELAKGEDASLLESWKRLQNIWCDYSFDLAGFQSFARYVDENPEKFRQHILYLLCARSAEGPGFPFDFRSPGVGPRVFSVGLYCSAQPGDVAGIKQARMLQRACLERCMVLGGRPYLYGVRDLTSEERRTLYGGDYERLLALRGAMDPEGLFNPGARL